VKHVPKEWLLKEFPNLASENRSTFFAVDAEHYSPYPAVCFSFFFVVLKTERINSCFLIGSRSPVENTREANACRDSL